MESTKIELIHSSETSHRNRYYFDDCFTLKIDGVVISNRVSEDIKTIPNYFQTSVCDWCGQSCDAGDFLSIVRHEKSLLFIPCFDEMDGYKERDSNAANGDYGEWECPPHEWYESGILEIDEMMLPVFLGLLTSFKLEDIPFITDDQMDKVLDWEVLVKEKPVDFMRSE